MARPIDLALIGGFLGAGKTTTLLAIARRLAGDGRRVGLITNDQAEELVDTATLADAGLPTVEIAGGCFCCRFGDFMGRCREILDRHQPDLLLAEPVGSCADLSATVLQPIKRLFGDQYRVLPFSVLVDPLRLEPLADPRLAESPVGYLFWKQIEEADIVVVNKADLLDPPARRRVAGLLAERLPATRLAFSSALTGEGLDDWWADLGAGPAGQRLLDIDYDRYADAEAAMGWLNATVCLAAAQPFDAVALGREVLAGLSHQCGRELAEIGHIKLRVESAGAAARLHLTRLGAPLDQVGDLPGPVTNARLILNARVTMPPQLLDDLTRRYLRRACNSHRVTPTIERLGCLSPGRPTPEHRDTVVTLAE